ncbi:MAG TPA: AI-2E family transporter, partial [Desulfurivibrionaceae bacterium]|nr:AI-2E family transporter [Desulfurivibrionaceae bacterium]
MKRKASGGRKRGQAPAPTRLPVAPPQEAASGPSSGPALRSPSPRWTMSAKLLVGLTSIALLGALVLRFGSLIRLLIVAAIVAFVASPVVRVLNARTRLSWRLATHLVFLVSIVLLILVFTATGLALAQEIQSLVLTVQAILRDIPGLLESLSHTVIVVGPIRLDFSQFDLASLANQAVVYIRPVLGQMSGWVTALAGGAIES